MKNLLEESKKSPFVFLIVPLIIGIIFSTYFSSTFPYLTIIITSFVALCLLIHYSVYNFRWIWGMVLYINIFCIGCFLIQKQQTHTNIPTDKEYVFKLKAEGNPVEKSKSFAVKCKIEAIKNGSWEKCNENTLLYFKSDSETPKAGDIFLCKTKFSEIALPANPHEFNYKQYMAQKGYFVTSFVNKSIIYTGENNLGFYLKWPLKLQALAMSAFRKAEIKDRELAIISALVIGDKSYIDADLNSAFSTSGVIHLLAISGLHVGIIYAVLNFILSFLGKGIWQNRIKTLVIIFTLWFYASIAGFSPSVVRASFMFTIFVVGNHFSLNGNTYNSIAFSAFVICIINPYSLFDLSFLLSYCAVIGIVFFQKRIYNLWKPKNLILKYTWMLSTVSLSAQIATAPIVLYYFNKFPNYFLLSNLLILPLATLAMYLAIVLLFVSFSPFLLKIVGEITQYVLSLINKLVFYFESLPYALTDGIYIDQFQYLLLAFATLLFGIFCFTKKTIFVQTVIISLILVFSIKMFREKEWMKQYSFGQYNIRGTSFYYHFNSRNAYKILDTANYENYNFRTRQHLIHNGFVGENQMKHICVDSLPNYYKGVFLFKNKHIGFAGKLEIPEKAAHFKLEYLIADISLKKAGAILESYFPEKILLDKCLSNFEMKEWKTKFPSNIVDNLD